MSNRVGKCFPIVLGVCIGRPLSKSGYTHHRVISCHDVDLLLSVCYMWCLSRQIIPRMVCSDVGILIWPDETISDYKSIPMSGFCCPIRCRYTMCCSDSLGEGHTPDGSYATTRVRWVQAPCWKIDHVPIPISVHGTLERTGKLMQRIDALNPDLMGACSHSDIGSGNTQPRSDGNARMFPFRYRFRYWYHGALEMLQVLEN